MSEPIKAGDLVQIVKPMPCGCAHSVGWIYEVVRVGPPNDFATRCHFCCATIKSSVVAYRADGCAADVDRLKRIPPLSESEGVTTEEKIREPA